MALTNEIHPLIRKVELFLRSAALPAQAGILVACSGGPDSTALLAGLGLLPDRAFRVESCYVDHGMKSAREIEDEVSWVSELSAHLGIPFHRRRIPDGAIRSAAKGERRSVEEVAREQRYRLLRTVARDRSLQYIAVGHTLDDQVETILMRVLQGAGTGGLAGIPSAERGIIRPLLDVTRDEVSAFLAAQGLRSCSDSTNASDAYLRNRLRRELVSPVRALFPAYRSSVARLCRDAQELNEVVDLAADAIEWTAEEGGYRTPIDPFLAAPRAVRLRSLMRLNDQEKICRRMPSAFFDPLIHPGHGKASMEPRRRLSVRGHGIEIFADEESLHWKRSIVPESKRSYLIEVESDDFFTIDGPFALRIVRERGPVPPGSHPLIAHEDVKYPLVVRSRKPGDRVVTAGGTKVVKKLLVEEHTNEKERWKIPIVEDREGIVAVLGSAVGARDVMSKRALAEPRDRVRWAAYFPGNGERR